MEINWMMLDQPKETRTEIKLTKLKVFQDDIFIPTIINFDKS